jgi:hypothetical protein
MSFKLGKNAPSILLSILLIATSGFFIDLSIRSYQMFSEMNFNFLLRKKNFDSLEQLNSFVKNLKLTSEQSEKALELINKNGLFRLNELNLSDDQIKIVQKGSESLRDINKKVFEIIAMITAVLLLVSIYIAVRTVTGKKSVEDIDQKINSEKTGNFNLNFLNFESSEEKQNRAILAI